MNNPFEMIEAQLSKIEVLILNLMHQSNKTETTEHLEQFLTVPGAAEFLNLSVPTIYSKVSKGELPVMKRGKRLYFSSTELVEYIKDGRQKSQADIDAAAEAYLSNKKTGLNNE